MKIRNVFLCAAMFAPLATFAQSLFPACPASKGGYLLENDSWTPIDPSHSATFKTTNVAAALMSWGAAKAKVKVQFRDEKSPYQSKAGIFAMCLVDEINTGRDITLAQFQARKDRRELTMATYRDWSGYNVQIDPKSLIPVDVEKKGDQVYVITSKSSLPNGEFILFTSVPEVPGISNSNSSGSVGGYDFGRHGLLKNASKTRWR